MPGAMKPPYFTSSGDIDSDELVSFIFGNQLTEFDLSQTVPRAVALRVLRHFCETGALSDEIRWEMD